MGSSGRVCGKRSTVEPSTAPFLSGYITHEVKAGDTFFSIAKMYDTTMERVMHANPGTDAGALQIGSTVVVPLNFPLVSGEVPYTSLLTGWIIEGLQALSLSAGGNDRKKCYGNTPVVAAVEMVR